MNRGLRPWPPGRSTPKSYGPNHGKSYPSSLEAATRQKAQTSGRTATAISTAARRLRNRFSVTADVAAMKWTAIAGKTIHVRQSKTKTELAIHMHPALVEALAAVQPRRADTILTGEKGRSLNPIYFGHL